MKKLWLWYSGLVLVMLVTGVFWGTWFTLTRSLESFPPDDFIRIGQTIIHNVAMPMRILMPATLLMQLLLCIAFFRQRPAFYFMFLSFLLMLITLLITLLVEVPIDNRIRTWTIDTIPADWTTLRDTWKQYHGYRTLTGILSFCILCLPVLYRKKS